MDSEVELLVRTLVDPQDIQVGPVEIAAGVLHGCSVLVARSGVGKVNAASAALALVSLGASSVLNTGAAGGLGGDLSIGDFVVATDLMHHDVDVCNMGYELGQVPGMPVSYEATPELADAMADAIAQTACAQVHRGRIVSGDAFVRDLDERQRIAELFGALCCDMESAAISQVCATSGVPYAVVRAISDLADGSMPERYLDFETKAAHASADALMAYLDGANCGE